MKSKLPALIAKVDASIARLQAHKEWLTALQETWRPFADIYPKLAKFAASPEGVLVRDCMCRVKEIIEEVGFRPEQKEDAEAQESATNRL